MENKVPIDGHYSYVSMTGYTAQPPKVVGYLRHEPTRATISVYKHIGWFKQLMIRWCLGLEYCKIKE